MTEVYFYVGTDVAKVNLEVHTPWLNRKTQVENRPTGFKRFIQLLRDRAQESGALPLVVLEATGGYQDGLVDALVKASIAYRVVNPKRARDFAKSEGILAKTDRIDASMLTLMGEQKQFRPDVPVSPATRQLQELSSRREALIRMRTMEKNRLHQTRHPQLRKEIQKHIKCLDKQIEQVNSLQRDLLREEKMEEKVARMIEVKGIGPLTAGNLLAEMPELGQIEDQAVVALAGLAPFNDDSGTIKGKRIIRGGRGAARQALYMPALVAARHNPVLAPFYNQLVKRGKPKKVALVAVMRKLLILLNRMLARPEMVIVT